MTDTQQTSESQEEINAKQAKSFNDMKAALVAAGFQLEDMTDSDVVSMITMLLQQSVETVLANKLNELNKKIDDVMSKFSCRVQDSETAIDAKILQLDALIIRAEAQLQSITLNTQVMFTLSNIGSVSCGQAYADSQSQVMNAKNYFLGQTDAAFVRFLGVLIKRLDAREGWAVV